MQPWVRGNGPVEDEVAVLGSVVPSARLEAAAENQAIRAAALLAAPWERSLLVHGKDAAKFLHALLTQDIKGMSTGDARPAALASRKGHLLADLTVYRETDTSFRIRVGAPYAEEVALLFARHRFAEKVEWRLEPDAPACFLLVGPEAGSQTGRWGRPDAQGGPVPGCGPEAHWMRVAELTNEDRLVVVPEASAGILRELLNVPEIGWAAFDLARIERGRAWQGIDTDGERLVPEPDWDDRISYTKGCYLGQETLARLHYLGQRNWSLACLSIQGTDPVLAAAPLLDPAGERVGWVTSTAPRGAELAALGFLHRKFRENPRELRLADGRSVVPGW